MRACVRAWFRVCISQMKNVIRKQDFVAFQLATLYFYISVIHVMYRDFWGRERKEMKPSSTSYYINKIYLIWFDSIRLDIMHEYVQKELLIYKSILILCKYCSYMHRHVICWGFSHSQVWCNTDVLSNLFLYVDFSKKTDDVNWCVCLNEKAHSSIEAFAK